MDSLSRRFSRLNIDIVLNGQVKGIVPSYTTFDKIEGEVLIRADKNTDFDHVLIIFEGTSKTTIPRQSPVAHIANNLTAHHPFLKLRQPIDQTAYPEPREFEPGQLYTFPFTFVIPDHLLPQACNHYTNSEQLKSAHMQLPPSFGDAMISDNTKTLLDDMVPVMSEIAYKIKVTVLKRNTTSPEASNRFYSLSSIAKKVRIISATVEQPPLDVECDYMNGYRTRREKLVRKALLGGKTGRLVVTAAQPKPLQLPARAITTDCTISSHVKLHVRFNPENDDEQPPRLRSIMSKLKVMTYYSAHPWSTFPSKELASVYNSMNKGLYTETVGLSSLCVVSAQWEKHDGTGPDDSRRSSLESGSSDGSSIHPLASASYSGKPFYTAAILVPVSLPTNKAFVPTFHSCLTSRVYALDLSLTYQAFGTKILAPSISLSIPIQITSAPGDGIAPIEDMLANHTLPETHIEEEYYRPRSIAPPSEYDYMDQPSSPRSEYSNASSPTSSVLRDDVVNYDGGNNSAPPEYSVMPPASGVRTSHTVLPGWVIRARH